MLKSFVLSNGKLSRSARKARTGAISQITATNAVSADDSSNRPVGRYYNQGLKSEYGDSNRPVKSRTFMKSILAFLPCMLVLFASAACAGSLRSDALPALPTPEDPQLANMLQRLVPEYERWLDNPTGYIISPARQLAWPCEVSQSDKERLAGVPDPRDPKLLASYAKNERLAGLKPGTIKPNPIENAQVHIVKGGCSAGKLNGELELLAEYVEISHSTNERFTARKFSRIKAVEGKPVGERFEAYVVEPLGSKNDRFTRADFYLGEDGQYKRSARISYMRTESPKFLFGTDAKVTQSVFLVQPISGDRWKQISYYDGPSKTGETLFKGDVLHGKSKSFYSSGRDLCYDEGELIMSVACDVD